MVRLVFSCPNLLLLNVSNVLDEKNCASEPQELLVVARRTDICVIYLDSPDYSYKVIPLGDVKYSITVDFDPVENYLYWSDDEVKKIQKSKLNGEYPGVAHRTSRVFISVFPPWS